MNHARRRLFLRQVLEHGCIGGGTSDQDVVVRFDETFTSVARVVLVSQPDLLRTVVFGRKDRDPLPGNAVGLEGVCGVDFDAGPFGAVAFDFGGGAEVEDCFYA